MTIQRDRRREQLQILMKTVCGRERIRSDWRKARGILDNQTASLEKMVDEILDAEFPKKFVKS